MYHLQLTIYEEHGDYQCHSYLWRHEPGEPDQLVDQASDVVAGRRPLPDEHAEIMSVIAAHMSVLLQDTPGGHAGALFELG